MGSYWQPKRQIRLTHYLIKKTSKGRKISNAKARYTGTQPRLKLLWQRPKRHKKKLWRKNLIGKRMTASSKFSTETLDCHFNSQHMHAGCSKKRHVCTCVRLLQFMCAPISLQNKKDKKLSSGKEYWYWWPEPLKGTKTHSNIKICKEIWENKANLRLYLGYRLQS